MEYDAIRLFHVVVSRVGYCITSLKKGVESTKSSDVYIKKKDRQIFPMGFFFHDSFSSRKCFHI